MHGTILGLLGAITFVSFVTAAAFTEMAARTAWNMMCRGEISFAATLALGIWFTATGTFLAAGAAIIGDDYTLLRVIGIMMIGFGYICHIKARAGAAGWNAAAAAWLAVGGSVIAAILAVWTLIIA